jgi:hypothetical protein
VIDLNEQWRVIPGWEDYEVSDSGNVRRRVAGGRHWEAGRWLKPGASDTGHLYVMLSANNRAVKQYVHRLVLLAFIGPPPFDEAMALHDDDIPTHNNLGNLYWGTRVDNYNDRMRNRGWDRKGTAARGSSVAGSILTESDIPKIRKLRAEGKKLKEIAELFGVGTVAICQVATGKTWAHIQ